ncbi:AMP-binding protein [Azospirillum doebereinerae]|uniref:AMP-binding protein n=1 Tax=Azospirillum doebereinerae TaxID=92933 RepID=UPI001EE50D68|nr:AMP-binding protein [Azospirillum doebereinerae]MCG5239326.1 AMP-binding protein [Azospirillum doebereinerae]
MKLSDLTLFDAPPQEADAGHADVPIPDTTIDRLIAGRARSAPDAVAVIEPGRRYSYRELDAESNRIAAFLLDRRIGNAPVAVLAERSFALAAALLGILRAGAVYAPVNPAFPLRRQQAMLRRTAATVLLYGNGHAHAAQTHLWECPDLAMALCLDHDDPDGAAEPEKPRMVEGLWDHVAATASDAVSGGGWRSAITGERFPDWVMRDYADNVRVKLARHLTPASSVLEVGCGSGLTMAALAGRAGSYLATDLSGTMIGTAGAHARARGLDSDRLSFRRLAAHDLGALKAEAGTGFDVVVLNSVVQSFSGYGYLRRVLATVLELCADEAVIFLGHLWNAGKRDAYADAGASPESLDALFVSPDFLRQLPREFPAIAAVEITPMTARARNELTDFGFDCVLRIRSGAKRAADGLPPATRLRLGRGALAPFADAPPLHAGRPEDTAYLIFTSGSSGTPKPAANTGRALLNLCLWFAEFCDLGPGERVYQVIACSFDASIKNYLATFAVGATAVLLPEGPYDPARMLDILQRERVGVLNPGVPSQIHPMIDLAAADGYRALASLRVLALGGEAPDPGRLRDWLRSPACRLEKLANIYGPTECADITAAGSWRPDELADRKTLPIGRPIRNARCYILDSGGRALPDGAVGELCIGGAGVGTGYPGDEALTAERFQPDPFRPDGRMYRTGDLAWRREDGQIVLTGRQDDEVKIRGHRMTLGEIEAHLRTLPGVEDAAALCRAGEDGEPSLVAFLAADGAGGGVPDEDRLAALLADRLPAAMVPGRFVRLAALPRNAHGKLDRAALAALRPPPAPSAVDTPAVGTVERRVMRAWSYVLGDRPLAPDDDFFRVGGHSLAVVMLQNALVREFGHAPPLADLHRDCTVRGHARLIATRPDAAAGEEIGRFLTRDEGPPVFCFPPIVGLGWVFAALAERLDGLRLFAFDFVARPDRIARYADAVADAAAGGPVVLCGYSAGGNLAHRVAVELERREIGVDRIVLIDSEPRLGKDGPSEAEALAFARRSLSLLGPQGQTAEAVARLEAYTQAHRRDRDDSPVSAPVALVLSRSMRADPSDAWRSVCRGGVTSAQAAGHHDDVIGQDNLGTNAPLLRRLLDPRLPLVASPPTQEPA